MTYEFGLELFWYIIIIVSIICYAMLDGFDLGTGVIHLFAKTDFERRVFLNAIGPVWDGNEVWLIIVVGGLLAGFPYAYATLFSGLYTPLIILIFALIFRAVAIEFRSKHASKLWRNSWDTAFFLGSLVIALGVGVCLGNLISGLPLDQNMDYQGSFKQYLNPYALLVGVLTLSLFIMHGIIYLVMKTEDELHDKLRAWITPAMIFFIICYAVTTMVTLIYQSHMTDRFRDHPYLFILAFFNILAIANIPREISKKNDGWAFISSCANIAFLMIIFAVGTFPNLIRSSVNTEEWSITAFNAGASTTTLTVLLIIVAIGVPLVIAYGIWIYHIFRGKVKIDHMSY